MRVETSFSAFMEIILVVEAEEPSSSESLDRSESAMASNGSSGSPRRPSGTIRPRRKTEHDGSEHA
jgi:hypothetical protein